MADEKEPIESQENIDASVEDGVSVEDIVVEASGESVDDTVVQEDESSSEAGAEEDVVALKKALEEAQAEAKANKDEVLRAKAEADNIRRRAEKDVEGAHKYALEKFVGELLPVYDSLERGLDSIKGDDEHAVAMREGMDMTKKLFLKTIEKFGVSMVEPLDQPFNPELHQAMTMQESAEHEPNTVMNVFQPGFLLNGRLIRPAMVVVAREPAPKIDERA